MPAATPPRRAVLAGGGALVALTASALLAASPASARVAVPGRATAATLTADYRFQGTRTSSVAGAPALVDVPAANTFTTATVDGTSRQVLTFTKNHGVRLTTTGVVGSTSYSVVVLAQLTKVDGYRRLLDVKHGSADTGLYVDSGVLVFYNAASGSGVSVTPRTWTQYVLTRSPGSKVVTGYVDGVKQFSFIDTAGDAVIDAQQLLTFFRDNNVGGGAHTEASPGSVARIRLYDGPLTANQVKLLDREP